MAETKKPVAKSTGTKYKSLRDGKIALGSVEFAPNETVEISATQMKDEIFAARLATAIKAGMIEKC